jgi:hypothetical protein
MQPTTAPDLTAEQQVDLDQLGNDLEIARTMFRQHPELVTGDRWPEPLRSQIIRYCSWADDEDLEDAENKRREEWDQALASIGMA